MIVKYIGNEENHGFFDKDCEYKAKLENGRLYAIDNHAVDEFDFDHLIADIFDEDGNPICDVDNIPDDFYKLDKWFTENFEIIE